MCTGADLFTDKDGDRLDTLFVTDANVEVEATWGVHQQLITAYRDPTDRAGNRLMTTGIPTVLNEVATLGPTLTKRSADIRGYFGRPGTSNGPTEAINEEPLFIAYSIDD